MAARRLEAVAAHSPDVVVMDLQMPGLNGIEATRQIVREDTGVAVLVLTMFEDDESVFSAVRAGARGYLLKGAGQGGDRAGDRSRQLGRGDLRPRGREPRDHLLRRCRAGRARPPLPPSSPTASARSSS